MGQHRYKEQSSTTMPANSLGGLGHLHQAENPFMHACSAATARKNNHGQPLFNSEFKAASKLFTYYRTHTATNEGKVDYTKDHWIPLYFGASNPNGIIEPGCLLGFSNALAVTRKRERIKRVERFKWNQRLCISNHVQTLHGRQTKVMSTAADMHFLFQFFVINHLGTVVTPSPQIIWKFLALLRFPT